MADVQYADVIRTVNGLLKQKYPEITRYGNDTVDKAVPPYFFVECVPAGMDWQTKNMLHKSCSVLITYVQRVPNQLDNLEKAEEIGELLGMTVRIRDRELLVLRYSHEYIGDQNNILQISFGLDWWEDTRKPDTEEIMENLHTEMTVKGD